MRSPRRVLALVAALVLAGCTSGGGGASTSTSATAATRPAVSVPPSSATDRPVATGPTTAARAAACPYVATRFVMRTLGMRLGRITVLRANGKQVGCRIYALQGGPLARSEHLPGPNQPALEITTTRYGSAVAAHNAFVRAAGRGRNAERADLGHGIVGVCFQNDFYPKDHGKDWACAASKGTLAVLVRSVDTTGSFNTIAVTKAVLRDL